MADLWTLLSILPTTFPICDFSLDLTLLGSHASLLSVLPPVFWIRHKTNTNAFPYVEYLFIDTLCLHFFMLLFQHFCSSCSMHFCIDAFLLVI